MNKDFAHYIAKEMRTVRSLLRDLPRRRAVAGKLPSPDDYPLRRLGRALKAQTLGLPPPHVEADVAIPCFTMAATLKRPPVEIAVELAGQIGVKGGRIAAARADGPYVNIVLDRPGFGGEVLDSVEEQGSHYGFSKGGAAKVVVVDFSSPNIAKPLGVGHLRSTIIGAAIARLYRSQGFVVITDNHLGDWGTQFGKLLVAYRRWWRGRKKIDLEDLMGLYVRFHDEVQGLPGLEAEARAAFAEIEVGAEEPVKLWLLFRSLSLRVFEKVYRTLGTGFDLTLGESFYNSRLGPFITRAIEEGVARDEGGAVVVDLGDPAIPSFLLRKEDGSSLYMTRDLATLEFRRRTLKADRIVYVVGHEQTLHFRQCFRLAARLGYGDEALFVHLPFGLILSGGGKMSTREGTLVGLEEVLDEAVAKAQGLVREKNPELSKREQDEVAHAVGIGSVIYNDLSQSREKNIVFDWNRMLDFRGGSAPYLQYTYVRIMSILRKLGRRSRIKKSRVSLETPIEWGIVKKLAWWPQVLTEALRLDALHPIATYLEGLAGLFHQFYQTVPVKDAAPEYFPTRVRLIRAVAIVIKTGLGLLGIAAPAQM